MYGYQKGAERTSNSVLGEKGRAQDSRGTSYFKQDKENFQHNDAIGSRNHPQEGSDTVKRATTSGVLQQHVGLDNWEHLDYKPSTNNMFSHNLWGLGST